MNPPFVDIHSHRPPTRDGSLALVCVDPARAARPAPPGTSFCCAVHPWEASATDAGDRIRAIRGLVDENRLSAIGETGFDRIRRTAPLEAQIALFRLHADLADEAGLPLVVHSVRANADVLAESSRRRARSVWIIHGCSAGPEELERILSKGIAVSMGPRELARPGAGQALRGTPPDLLFLETDDSEVGIEEVYRVAAGKLDCPVDSLVRRIHGNWLRLFGKTTRTVT